ncbi:phosphatase PAP2 family protein [Psychrobacter lutiphocae]|uniref:phosphatase PAP2 family protein n=1 Tax=Psychrobacter lutiphocae TaxID=540500 RepID=UPI00068534F0|nr:phosphatase PAP2 family protein [Psychrobacter lutiphocae]
MATFVNQLILWDTSVCIHFNRYSDHRGIAKFFKIISRLGDGWFWYLMLVCAFVRQGASAIVPLTATLLVGLIGLVVYKLLKAKTVRPRPYQVHQAIVLGERPLDVFSFPSGHTLQAVLFTSSIGVYVPELLPVMLVFTFLIALSRMILGLHYPTDVLVGAGIGYALSLWVNDIEGLIVIGVSVMVHLG